jgi:rhodanese-related sulfurtransferase/DNA-binding HxlR family transcriptional regulator
MPDHTAKVELFDQFARVAGALASGRRAEIVDVLANGERSVEELSRQVDLSVANTSQHLQVLKEAGLVTATREGTRVRYRLSSPAVYRFWVTLRSLAAERLPGLERLAQAYLGSREDVDSITREELQARLAAGEPLLVVDVRPVEEYAVAHLPGALSIPLPELESRLSELPADREIVAYCRGPYCAYAPDAVRLLRSRGLSARALEDGFPDWAAAGNPSSGLWLAERNPRGSKPHDRERGLNQQ